MTWKVRHEGSPQAVNVTLEELSEQLVDGMWEPTDEVLGPGETAWQALENHPQFEEIAAELEAPPPRVYDDEARLDMNALIDVTLVLLVFFILTTSVAALQKQLEAPTVEEGKAGIAVLTKDQVANQLIHVKVKLENGSSVVRVEDKVIDIENAVTELQRFVRSTGKTSLLLEHDDDVPQDLVVRIIDAAKGAGMDKVRLLIP